uniref:(California timema) hypothetical protein n=1 Tax=Timema californicum TaxID=61474 RepID=A0A7R9J4M2_TIMCA|nr:unnamed protein product [Timema californicum]
MRKSFLWLKKSTPSRRKELDMSAAVPLMTLHNSNRGSSESLNSDQMSDEEDNPLESVLARMKHRSLSYRSQEFWSGLTFAGVMGFVAGFVVSYVVFISFDKNSAKLQQSVIRDADPGIASSILQSISSENIIKYVRYSFQREFKLQSLVSADKGDENFPELTHDAVPFVIEEIRASDLQQYITSLNVEPSDDLSSDLKQARILWQHFKDQGLDIVSHIHESSILLTFASRDSPSGELYSSESERSEQVEVAADIDNASVNTSDYYWDEINLEDQDNPPQPLHIYAEVPGLKSRSVSPSDSKPIISIVDESGATKFNLSGLLSSAPPKVEGQSVHHIVKASVAYVNFGRDTDFDYLEGQQHILIANNILLARLGKVPPIILVDRALSRGALGVLLFADPEAALVTAERQLVTPAQLGLMQALHGDPSTLDKQAVVHGESNAKLECVPVEVISPESAEQIVRGSVPSFVERESEKQFWGKHLSTHEQDSNPDLLIVDSIVSSKSDSDITRHHQGHQSRHMLANDDTPVGLFGKSNSIFNRATGFSNINHKIKLEVNFINVVRVFHSVMAGIRGSREPDRHILLVTSRESLLNNELGPTGGTAAMMELAKVFGVLLNTKGWRPHRSIVFCNLGLAFMEGHYISPPFMDSWGDLLESNVVSYLSVDNPVADNRSLEVEVSPLLSKVVQDSSALVPNPRLLEVTGNSQKTGQSGLTLDTTWVSAGFAASNSNLDIDSDPGLRSHKAMTQLWGILTWKMADSLLLPFSPTSYAEFLNSTLTAIKTKYKHVISENKLVLKVHEAFTTADKSVSSNGEIPSAVQDVQHENVGLLPLPQLIKSWRKRKNAATFSRIFWDECTAEDVDDPELGLSGNVPNKRVQNLKVMRAHVLLVMEIIKMTVVEKRGFSVYNASAGFMRSVED